MKKKYNMPIVVEGDDDGYFALCPTLQGCYSCGSSYEEAMDNIQDAIRLHILDIQAHKGAIRVPKTLTLTSLEVAV